ncbi:sulfite exporter TauE/SafE family protein [Desulfofundulus thermosubterraneus]|uniref:Probable membrane transporter protein n=1 Tax=Desulfofundulus thermosubterraneus DSM 16057 TaxID=1121432 RepID=A0A1M6G5K4_9FIRM|nr:sulfite exporter TauE/SafE family protein [Desulfofundulus thermosubterraneus]SHJ05160.1 Uncharacterized membrane protein YfcA [Desulfofundulus thermosubterraneus DSM 16057]
MIFSLSWLVAALAVTLATTLQAVTGFGAALILVPLLVLAYNAHTAVGMTMVISFCSLALLTYQVRKNIIKPMARNLSLGGLAGIPLGAYVFIHFDVTRLKIIIALVTLAFALALLLDWVPRKSFGSWTEAIVGAAGGFLGASVGMPGPPVVLFLNHQEVPKEQFRATTAAYFCLVYPASLLLLLAVQALERQTILTALSLVPFALLGQALGFGIFPRVSQELFRRGVPLLVTLVAIYSLATTLF